MNLYILRHASAGVRRPNPLLDVKRPLDKEGKAHCLHLAYVLNALKVSFDCVISSPLKRSVQTAQLVATETGFERAIELTDALAPDATFSEFKKLLEAHQSAENLLVVGHSPNIQSFLGGLLVPPAQANVMPAQVRMRKGSIARVSLTRGPAVLTSVLDPRTVKALYTTSTKSSRLKTSRK
jgi:phosphohistidine phosphatase